jgi:hypothetical protein
VSSSALRVLVWFQLACYVVVSVLFALAALGLVGLAGWQLLNAATGGGLGLERRLAAVLDSVAILTIAVAALELSQTIMEEEVQRTAHIAAPTRVRRFLSRFLAVVVVALSIEALVTIFRLGHDDPGHLPEAAAVAGAAALLLAGWGVFIHFNRGAEELEPEAMADAKREDRKLEPPGSDKET